MYLYVQHWVRRQVEQTRGECLGSGAPTLQKPRHHLGSAPGAEERRVSPARALAQDPAFLASGRHGRQSGSVALTQQVGACRAVSSSEGSPSSSQETNQLCPERVAIHDPSRPLSPLPSLLYLPSLPLSPDLLAGLWVGSPRWMEWSGEVRSLPVIASVLRGEVRVGSFNLLAHIFLQARGWE